MKYNAYKDWHHWIIATLVLLAAAYRAAYPYLNPSNFQLQDALYYGILAVAALLVYGHKVTMQHAQIGIIADRLQAIENRLGMGDTHSMPVTGPQGINLPQRPPREDQLY